jgi:hypothetical protein
MFRKTLEGRFVLDVILQSAIAASALAHEYLISVLHTSAHEVATPRPFHAARMGGEGQRAAARLAREMIVRRPFTMDAAEERSRLTADGRL